MNNNGRRPSFREMLTRFMAGRYGVDSLYYFLLAVYIILAVIDIFLKSAIISGIGLALYIYAIYRCLSRNVYKRQNENVKFLEIIEKPKKFVDLQKRKHRDRKTHVYRKCPSCKSNLRLPKRKGKHTVVCPCCKHRFEVRI